MYRDASILVVGVLALKVKKVSSNILTDPLKKTNRLTTVIAFFLSAYIAKFDLDLSFSQ